MKETTDVILKIDTISIGFDNKILDDVSLELIKGKTLGLVGKSGCGKTTLGKILVKFYKQDAGDVYYNGVNICNYSNKDLSKCIQMVFQNSYSALNPSLTIRENLLENLIVHDVFLTKNDKLKKVKEVLNLVAVRDDCLDDYPHQLSGGEVQRIGIARALILEPEIIILDEITSSLDVNTQAEIINLLLELQIKLNITYLFISHDLSIIRAVSDYVAIMNHGEIVEYGLTKEVFNSPKQKYTRELLNSNF